MSVWLLKWMNNQPVKINNFILFKPIEFCLFEMAFVLNWLYTLLVNLRRNVMFKVLSALKGAILFKM